MPPTVSDIYARAHHHVSSGCHPRQVACMQQHDAQNPGQTIPWMILQRSHKTQGLPLVSPTYLHHYVSSMCHFISDTYARARQCISSTCHPRQVSCMQEHNTCIAHKTRQTQALRLVILKCSQNPRLVLGNLRHSSTSLTKPRANTSPVQGSTNPMFTLGEPFLLLSSIFIGTQGMQGLPMTIFSFPNFHLCRNTSISKTQGPPLVHTPTKPKAPLGPFTHNNYDDHFQRSKFNKTNYHQTILQDLQSSGSHSHSS